MSCTEHPNIVPFLGICFDPEWNYLLIVSRLMRRGSLHDVIARGTSQQGPGGGGESESDGPSSLGHKLTDVRSPPSYLPDKIKVTVG